jgi:hypothetical protein
MIELLAYMPAGDDDFEYVIQPLKFGNGIDFITRLDRGNSNSSITVRITVLQWPSTQNVLLADDQLLLVSNDESRAKALPPWQMFSLITPTGYVTRGHSDVWYVTRVESSAEGSSVRLTVGGGAANSQVLLRIWSIAFGPPSPVGPIPGEHAPLWNWD